jgi:hypothetical protein
VALTPTPEPVDPAPAQSAATLQLLATLVEPREFVLPPFPAENRAALVTEIRDWMEALADQTPAIACFLQAVARCIV